MTRTTLRTAVSATIAVLVVFTGVALSPVPAAHASPLPIPPLLESSTNARGERVFDLRVQSGSRTFSGNTRTETLGYNGDYLGPTIRVRRGEDVRIRVRNTLPEPTTVHWHGAHLPAASDGGPHQRIPAGGSWEAPFTVDQPAATLWYHPHLMGTTAEQVYRGLAGLLIVDDDISESLAVPREYGRDDIPLVLQERRFSRGGSFEYRPSMPDLMHGYGGNALLTTGALEPYIVIRDERVRLRLLNGSNSTVLRMTLDDGGSFHQIATDGGFLERPLERRELVLSPGERAEIVVDFSFRDAGPVTLLAESTSGRRYRALELRPATTELQKSRPLPTRLATIPDLASSGVDRRRQFVMSTMGRGGRLTINGRTMDMNRIDEVVQLDTTEIWEVSSEGGGMGGMMGGMMDVPHNFHVHGLQFQVLRVNGRRPPPELRGWKDTVPLWPGDRIQIVLRFENYTGVFMYHCHFLEHEDEGMMGQFEVRR